MMLAMESWRRLGESCQRTAGSHPSLDTGARSSACATGQSRNSAFFVFTDGKSRVNNPETNINNTPIPRRSYEKQFKRDDGALMLAGYAVQRITFDDDMGFSGVAGVEKEQEEGRGGVS
jgi:hypothetical protein